MESSSHGSHFDVIIVGGSYAGLSAAMALGRSLRKVLIIDSGLPCNRQTPYSHNFITQDGNSPSAIAKIAKEQVLAYNTVQFVHDVAIRGSKTESGFGIHTAEGNSFTASKLLFASGIVDQMPDIKGFSECWGITVIHCPYCHGYEYRNKRTGLLMNGDKALHIASLVRNLTSDITLLTNGGASFTDEQLQKFNKHHISIIEEPLKEIVHEGGELTEVILQNGNKLKFDAIYASLPFHQSTDIPASLGCEITDNGYIKVDGMQQTTIEGVFACGDNSGMLRSVSNAVSTGGLAGAMINRHLAEEKF